MAGEWHTWQLIWYLRANAGIADADRYVRNKQAINTVRIKGREIYLLIFKDFT
jgi:hypothetical protein